MRIVFNRGLKRDMRVTVDGQRFEMATQREAEPEKWDSSAGRLIKSKK
jgi:hypothetical protein